MAAATRESLIKSHLIGSISRVDLRVRDIETAAAFYTEVVGLEIAEIEPEKALLRSPGGPVVLHLESSGVTDAADPHATGLFHTAFRFPTRAALGDALARVARARLQVAAGDHLVSEALYVDDPDGNGVELYWDRPIDEWPPPTEQAAIPMATLPVDLEDLYRAGQGEGAPKGTDIGHVHLQISDVERTTRFYVDVLGLDLTARLGGSASFLSSKGYHHHIGANAWRSRGGQAAAKDRAGLSRVVFRVTDRTELDALVERLSKRGWDAETASEEITLLDPDGIELRFVWADQPND